MMRTALQNMIQAFPLQLLVMHLKRNHFLIIIWIFLISIIAGFIGTRYGVPLLFLDPEYFGRVNFLSFYIIGVALGGLFIVWNITSYILNAHRYSFLATLNRPFGIYCLNNAILPGTFLLLYIFKIIGFQSSYGLLNLDDIVLLIAGLLCGIFTMIIISMLYFFRTNKDIFQIISGIHKKQEKVVQHNPDEPTHEEASDHHPVNTSYYLNNKLQWKHARSADHYPESIIRSVYKQHHANALFIEITSLSIILLLGLLMENPVFRIPAGASIALLLSILIVLIGAYYYWMGAWKLFFFVILFFIADMFMKSDMMNYENKIIGIDYQQPHEYTIDTLKILSDSTRMANDMNNTLAMLNNWRAKFPASGPAPKLIVINCSGGGLRAMSFAMQVFQHADSMTNNQLMEHTPLITGASGGMLAAAYYRELYLQKKMGADINLYDAMYADNMSTDLLNGLGFTMVVNDMFYPMQSFTSANTKHRKDRGYMFEKLLNENTGFVLNKSLGDYASAEFNMEVPMIVFTPTIINDERKLYIATQPVSYLARPVFRENHYSATEVDGVDVHHLLGDDANNMNYTSVLRMNCTFPYILPLVHLPTTPEIQVMDAGVRDNYGIQTSAQFIATFNEWIQKNTSGVIVVNVRAIEQELGIKTDISNGVLQKFASPVESLYSNWVEIQDYQNDQLLNYLDVILEGNLEVITFEYQPSENNKRASLSFHLTSLEKRDINKAVNNIYNKNAYTELAKQLGVK
jgi:hypothetical protein